MRRRFVTAVELAPAQSRRDLVAVLGGACGAFLAFNLVFSVVPLVAEREGGHLGAGLATGVFMVATVIGQLAVKTVVRRVPHRQAFVIGVLLIGVPALLYPVTDEFTFVLAVTAVRGYGFGLCTVIATVLVIAHVESSQRGSALGLFGLMSSGSSVFAPSLGLLLYERWGSVVFVVCAATSLALAPVALFSRRPAIGGRGAPSTYREMLAHAPLRRPLLVLLPATLLFGGAYSFIPLTSPDDAAVALLLFGLAMAITRTFSGKAADRVQPERLVAGFVTSAAAGALLMAVQPHGVVLLVGAFAAGFGVGGVMTGSLVIVLSRVSTRDYEGASTLWNTSVDAGLALGGVGLGVVALLAGDDSVFAAASVALVVAIPLAVADARWPRPGRVL